MIIYPSSKNEFEVQAEIYTILRSLKHDIRGEVIVRNPKGNKGYKQFRFDLVAFKDKKPIAIIEVKSPNHNTNNFSKTRQYKKYTSFGLPVFLIKSDTELLNLIAFLNA